jgi:hypothetical protein
MCVDCACVGAGTCTTAACNGKTQTVCDGRWDAHWLGCEGCPKANAAECDNAQTKAACDTVAKKYSVGTVKWRQPVFTAVTDRSAAQQACEVTPAAGIKGNRLAGDYCRDCRSQKRKMAGYGAPCDVWTSKASCELDKGLWVSVDSGVCKFTYGTAAKETCVAYKAADKAVCAAFVPGGKPDACVKLGGGGKCRYTFATAEQCVPKGSTFAAYCKDTKSPKQLEDTTKTKCENASPNTWNPTAQTCSNADRKTRDTCVATGKWVDASSIAGLCAAGKTGNSGQCLSLKNKAGTGTLCTYTWAGSCKARDEAACSAQTTETGCHNLTGTPNTGDCLWVGRGPITNQAACEGTISTLALADRTTSRSVWSGSMDLATARQKAADERNAMVVAQNDPSSRYTRPLRMGGGYNVFWSLKSRVTRAWQVTSEQTSQTFVVGMLLSHSATVEVQPQQAGSGPNLMNVLRSLPGTFWTSALSRCRTHGCENKVAVSLHLPAHFLAGGDHGNYELLAFCKVPKAVCDTDASKCTIKYSEYRLVDVCMFDKGLPRPKFDSSGKCHKQTAAGTNGATILSKDGNAFTANSCAYPNQANCAQAGGNWFTSKWTQPIDKKICEATGGTWTPSTSCDSMLKTYPNAATVFHANAQPRANPSECQLYQVYFWKIRYPFIPRHDKPSQAAGTACTNFRMRVKGRVRTQCVTIIGNNPVVLTSNTWAEDATACKAPADGLQLPPATPDPSDKASCTKAKGTWLPCNVPGKSAGTCGRTPCPSAKMTAWNKAQCLADGSVYDDIADTAAAREACLEGNNRWLGENCLPKTAEDKRYCASLLKPAQIADSVPPFGTTGTTHKCTADPRCTYTAASAAPVYGDHDYFGPSFATGAQVYAEGADAQRSEDTWTPKNPLTVTSLQFECKAPLLFMDYWSVFGIPRAPRTDYSKLDPSKCDGGERPIVADKTQQTNRAVMCGPRGAPKCPPGKTLTRYGECGYTSKIGDGVCDPEFNHAIFIFDELDCFFSAMEEMSAGNTMSFSKEPKHSPQPSPPASPCAGISCIGGSCHAGACQCAAGWSGTHCEIKPRCPGGATPVAGSNKYCSPLVGLCVGPGGSTDYVNGKYRKGVITQAACQAFCDAKPACVGYAYSASLGYCNVEGPGLDRDLGSGWMKWSADWSQTASGGWTARISPPITIAGADGGASGYPGYVCVAKVDCN